LRIVTFALFGVLLFFVGCAPVSKPDNAKAFYMLGVSYLRTGDPTSALREFLKSEAIESDDSDLQAALGQVYLQKKAYAKAEQHYLYALEIDSDNPQSQNNLAALYLEMARYNDAIEYFQLAADNLLFPRPEVAWTGIGYAEFKKGNHSAALEAFERAIAVNWRFATVYFRRGEVYFDLDQVDTAISEYNIALEHAPNFASVHYSLALALMKNRNIDQAISHFESVIKIAPNSQLAHQSKTFLRVIK
jgi:tetratricopeptide (TPR) repeat protein